VNEGGQHEQHNWFHTDLVKTCKALEIHLVDVAVIDIKIGDAQSSNVMKKVETM